MLRAVGVINWNQLKVQGRERPPSETSFTFIEKWLGIPLLLLFTIAGASAAGLVGVLAALGGGLYLGGERYLEIRGNRRLLARPRAAEGRPRGRIDAAAGETVGVSVVLHDEHGRLILRGGWTDGFRIALDDGRTLVVRAGSVVVTGTGSDDDSAVPELEEILAAFPARRRDRSRAAFPREHIYRRTLCGGEHLWIGSDLIEIPDPNADATSYRERAATVLSCSSVPELTIDHR